MKFKIIRNIFLFFIIYFLFIVNISYASEKKAGINNFPDSYKGYLEELRKKTS